MTVVSLRQHTRPPSPPPAMTTRTLLLLRRRSHTTTTTPFVPLSPPELHTARGFDVGTPLPQHLSGIATAPFSLTHLLSDPPPKPPDPPPDPPPSKVSEAPPSPSLAHRRRTHTVTTLPHSRASAAPQTNTNGTVTPLAGPSCASNPPQLESPPSPPLVSVYVSWSMHNFIYDHDTASPTLHLTDSKRSSTTQPPKPFEPPDPPSLPLVASSLSPAMHKLAYEASLDLIFENLESFLNLHSAFIQIPALSETRSLLGHIDLASTPTVDNTPAVDYASIPVIDSVSTSEQAQPPSQHVQHQVSRTISLLQLPVKASAVDKVSTPAKDCKSSPNQGTHLLILRFLKPKTSPEVIVFKTAISAVPFEILHTNVVTDSQSLVSLVNSFSDVNELRSALVDFRSLLRDLLIYLCLFISCSANVALYSV